MSEITLKKINNIPVRTWRWLGVNNISIDTVLPEAKPFNLDQILKNNKKINIVPMDQKNNSLGYFDGLEYEGVEKELSEQVKDNYNGGFALETKDEEKVSSPIMLEYDFDTNHKVLIDNNIIIAGENSEVTVIIRYNSKDEETYYHNGLTRIYGKKGAKITVVKIQTLSEESTHLDAIVAKLEEQANVNYVLVELGGKNSITNIRSDLKGNQSSSDIKTVYLGDKDRKIDINYLTNHYGKETNSSIDVKGALMDQCKKTFRGTIDFKTGSSGSKGQEEEYAILLSDKVRNRSVPILLCTEDDVEGQHAASTGKIDENKLFYLMTRGLSEIEAKKLIIEASITPIVDQVPDENVKEEIYEYVRGKLSNES